MGRLCVLGWFAVFGKYNEFDNPKHREMWEDEPHRLVERSCGPERKETRFLCSTDDDGVVRVTVCPRLDRQCACGCGRDVPSGKYLEAKDTGRASRLRHTVDDHPEYFNGNCKQRAHRHKRRLEREFLQERLIERTFEASYWGSLGSGMAAELKAERAEFEELSSALRAAETERDRLQMIVEGSEPS